MINRSMEVIEKFTGTRPVGWLGPGLGETHDTPDHLAAEGFEYVCDWGNDEQPTAMRVKSGRMVVVPYELGVNDIRVFQRENHTPEQYYRMVCDHFDTLYKDSASGGRVLCLPLHPFVIGMPFRIKYLEMALEYIEDDELVEVTPTKVRLRKIMLSEHDRRKAEKRKAV